MEDKGVFWGVDYYPEQWDPSYYKEDAKKMKEMGIKAVRIMEFAWILIEPQEGVYDFSLFDDVIEMMAAQGIKVVLGTPTATFPIWLYEKDPNMVQVSLTGIKRKFGTRREGCYNSDTYFNASMNIVEQCAKHFGSNPNVIGWQIDNELGHEGSDRCICENCMAKWHNWLEKRYKDIAELNKVWGTVFWGTTYSKFSEVPVPKTEVASIQNPNLFLDYYRFCSDSAIKFVNSQIEIVKKYSSVNQWITTNLYPSPQYPVIDMEQLTEHMDFASYDNYPIWGDQDEPYPYFFNAYVLSYIRGLNGRENYGIMEQFSGIQGHVCLGALPPEKQVVLWTNQAVARGANKIFYFRWRTAAFGQEQLCYGLFDSDNMETDRYLAISKNIKDSKTQFDLFASEPVESSVCVLYDKDNSRLLKDQYLSKGLYFRAVDYMQVGYDMELAKNYAPYVLFNVNADVMSVKKVDLWKYKLVSLPLYQMADEKFVSELEKWVNEGGILLLDYRTGTKDLNNHSVKQMLPGLFSKLAGIRVRKFESLNETSVKMKMRIIPMKGQVWADIIECDGAKPLAYYTDSKKHYKGFPSITVNQYGKGKVYYIGTSPDPKGLFFLYRKILKDANLQPKFYGQGIEVVKRRTVDGKYVDVILNHTKKAKRVKGKLVPPYEMRIV